MGRLKFFLAQESIQVNFYQPFAPNMISAQAAIQALALIIVIIVLLLSQELSGVGPAPISPG